MPKPILISGIQPTGRLHLGNYLGALKNFVELQNSGKYDCYFFVADYHSLTEDYEPKEKPRQILDLLASYLAAGLNPTKSVIFLQSDIAAHTELAWVLNTIAPLGELERMTQFGEKGRLSSFREQIKNIDANMQQAERYDNPPELVKNYLALLKDLRERGGLNMGLLDYPVLMSADILLYNVEFVPVGEDQLQHLELTRTLARKFNKKFGQTFIEPQPLLTEIPRLMSLDDPSKKMSKSRPIGCLFIDDEPKEIEAKIRAAVTDSGSEIKYDEKEKPGISNLLSIMAGLSGKTIAELEKQYAGANYGKFKQSLTNLVSDYFASFRKRKSALFKKPVALKKILQLGSNQARKIAKKKILEVKEKIGLNF